MRDYIDNPRLKVRGGIARGFIPSMGGLLRRSLLQALGLGLLAGFLVWLDMQGYLDLPKSTLSQGFSPIAQPLTGLRTGVSDTFATLGDLQHLQAENDALRQQNSRLQAELIAREQALAENVYLRQQLEIEQHNPWRLLGADISMRSPDAGRRVFTIARGSKDGVQVGMAVVGQTGTGPVALVGIVEEVSTHTASILMTTDFGSRVSARLLWQGETSFGLVQGQWQRGSRLRLEQVERESILAVGAIVVTAGLTGELNFPLPMAAVPPSVPIGEVKVLSNDGYNRFAELVPYADPDQVRYVWVILDQEK